jgi:PTH1 family peptidyl-tRNA hydrolase
MALLQFFKRVLRKETPPDSADVLFFGLGNKGICYAATRHNVGYRVADVLAERLTNRTKGRFAEAEYIQGTLFESQTKTLAVKPLTFMNRSGDAVKSFVEACCCPMSSVLVIVDDYHLPFGAIRARRGGSDGGHNGLKSVISRIGGDFPRLRFGIGPLPQSASSIDFVLSNFTEAEEKELKTAIARAADACIVFANEGIDALMNKFNS